MSLQTDVYFDGRNSTYSWIAKDARERLIDIFDWTITDGGLAPSPTISGLELALLITIISIIFGGGAIAAFVEVKRTKQKRTNLALEDTDQKLQDSRLHKF